jgi:hypothetical protein
LYEFEPALVSLTDWAAIVSAVTGVSAATFILLQLRHMEQHRNMEISMKLFEWAESDRLRKAFRWVEEEFQFEDYEKYRAVEKTNLEIGDYPYEVTAFFEQVGFMVGKKFVDLDVIVDRLGNYVISSWKKLEPWVLAIRKEKGDATFGEHFQRLYIKTVEYLRKSSPCESLADFSPALRECQERQ